MEISLEKKEETFSASHISFDDYPTIIVSDLYADDESARAYSDTGSRRRRRKEERAITCDGWKRSEDYGQLFYGNSPHQQGCAHIGSC